MLLEDGAAVRELQGEELQRWQASRGALEALDLSEEEAERVMKRAFGWTTQAWWRDSKVCEVPAQGQVGRQELATKMLCSCTVLWHCTSVLWHCTSVLCALALHFCALALHLVALPERPELEPHAWTAELVNGGCNTLCLSVLVGRLLVQV